MNSPRTTRRLLRLSLGELLLVVGFFAMASAALKYASATWWVILSSAALLLLIGAAVVAAIDRERRQAKASGFMLSMAIYGIVFYCSAPIDEYGRHRELDPDRGRLPTSRLLAPLHQGIASRNWIDSRTGEVVPEYDPNMGTGFGYGSGAGGIVVRESPPRRQFMAIGHLLWAMVLGYAGGRFAAWIYDRRCANAQRPQPSE
jgi:hypothetical protein